MEGEKYTWGWMIRGERKKEAREEERGAEEEMSSRVSVNTGKFD